LEQIGYNQPRLTISINLQLGRRKKMKLVVAYIDLQVFKLDIIE